jgi:hypothetical protein
VSSNGENNGENWESAADPVEDAAARAARRRIEQSGIPLLTPESEREKAERRGTA